MAKKPKGQQRPDYEKIAKGERELEVARQRELSRTMPAMLIYYEKRADGKVKMRRMRPGVRRKLMATEVAEAGS